MMPGSSNGAEFYASIEFPINCFGIISLRVLLCVA
jgi:hypothetical protein